MPETHRLKPGQKVDLAALSTRGKDFEASKSAGEKELARLKAELAIWQERLFAERKQQLLVVFQAMDTGGKDGATKDVFACLNPQGVQVTSFKVPTEEESSRDFLWRVHKAVPAKGTIGVFNRAHYEDVIVVRVANLLPEEVWRPRYEQINQFEQLLLSSGTRILKFFLHISEAEQKERLQARLDEPSKHWKFSAEDIAKRKAWQVYMQAYEEALSRCTTEEAPWYVIPADQKWYRNLAIARVVVSALSEMNPQYPQLKSKPQRID